MRGVAALGGHAHHHARFYTAALLGAAVWALGARFTPAMRGVIAGDAFFAGYLISTGATALREAPDALRRRARYEDEGILVILLLTACVLALSIASIFALMGEGARPPAAHLALCVASVPLGWLTLHTVAAFRYAHLYYARAKGRGDAGGLAFPGTDEPDALDFLYYSLVVGMTAQVSDVSVSASAMRRFTLAHAVVSFFYNTVLIALAVNVAASYAR
jgi:uncharacterized membrane protein